MNHSLHIVPSHGESDGRAKVHYKRHAALAVLLVALIGAFVCYASKPNPTQAELGRHVTEKYGTWLRSNNVTAIRYEEGTWSITEKLTIKGQSVDLSSDCRFGMRTVCGPSYTLFLGGTDSFDLVSVGDHYEILAKIDRSKTPYADSERQIDKAMDDIAKDYEKRQATIASWNKAVQ
ncbi:hypothetical protein [Ralstonia insidiosa]|jgi:hypothetical protein|nr:hypothetical protein [Ralstonia insidiosa]MBA9939874.1 hypothetical protein [Ralstonia insidiosa]MBC9968537.1 hypothetical protein [Ralstonia insidiosa]MBX3904642.1 hypothetical protein [Ralstonia insidiosa]